MEIRFFKHEYVEESEISDIEAVGILHFGDTYNEKDLIKHEKVSSGGLLLSATLFENHKFYSLRKHYDELGDLEVISYHFDQVESWYRPTTISFNTSGQVIYPIESEQKVESVNVVASRTVYPNVDLKDLSDQSIQIFTSKKNALFQPDYNQIRRALKNEDLRTPIVHGPDTDILNNDFLGVIARLRGNYGCDTITLHPTRGEFYGAMDCFNKKGEDIEALGVNLSYENLKAKNRWLSSLEQILDVDLPFVSLTLDISHLPPDVD